jgi:putative PIN family toxin of toxin-antitoxin system
MLRVVLDTSVIVAGLRSATGANNALLQLVARERLRPLVTPALFLEYESVLKRAEQQLAHGLEPTQIDRFLAALASASEVVEVRFSWRPQLSDPNDEMVLETAVNGRADAIVTHNVRDFAAAARFGLRVMQPRLVLQEIVP